MAGIDAFNEEFLELAAIELMPELGMNVWTERRCIESDYRRINGKWFKTR